METRVGSVEAVVCFVWCRFSMKFIYSGLHGSWSVLSHSAQWILALLLLSLLLLVVAAVFVRKRLYGSYPLVYIVVYNCFLCFKIMCIDSSISIVFGAAYTEWELSLLLLAAPFSGRCGLCWKRFCDLSFLAMLLRLVSSLALLLLEW